MRVLRQSKSSYRFYICKHKKNYLYAPGIDFGGLVRVITQDFESPYIVLKVSGHTGWSGMGQTSYYGPYYMIGNRGDWTDEKEKGSFDFIRLFEIEEYGRQWRDAEALASEIFLKLRQGVDWYDIKVDNETHDPEGRFKTPEPLPIEESVPEKPETEEERMERTLLENTTVEPREITLLRACYQLLCKHEDSHYVHNLLEQAVFYDNADCDGSCLKEDIEIMFAEQEKYNL